MLQGLDRQQYRVVVHRLLCFLIVFVSICFFTPFLPAMPINGLDPSWMLALNQAVAQHLVFGRDIIFTFGPYAGIYTHQYHPGVDRLIFWSALYFGSLFGLLALCLFRNSRWYLFLAFVILLGAFNFNMNTALMAYPFMLTVYSIRLLIQPKTIGRISACQLIPLVLFLSAFGLLLLLKGILLPLCCFALALIFCLLIVKGYYKCAMTILLTSAISLCFFWWLAGQPISALPDYFSGMTAIALGYGPAMMIFHYEIETLVYLLISAGMLWLLLRDKKILIRQRVLLSMVLSIFLFVVFKEAFVRHDGHAAIGGYALLFSILLLSTISLSRLNVILFFASLILSFFTNIYLDSPVIKDFFQGGIIRLAHSYRLNVAYQNALNKIYRENPLPQLQGSTDIYAFRQAELIASANSWDPRPVFQSHMAYLPCLIQKNKQHLVSNRAPDHIFFKVEAIDHRLPAMADGASWPLLLWHYDPVDFKNGYLILKRNQSKKEVLLTKLKIQSAKLNQAIRLPSIKGAIVTKIIIKPTLLGRIMSFIYKSSRTHISLTLQNGAVEEYVVVPNMLKTGVLMSPFISNTTQFGLLYTGMRGLENNIVKSFAISPGGVVASLLWQSKYTVEFYSLELPKKHVNF